MLAGKGGTVVPKVSGLTVVGETVVSVELQSLQGFLMPYCGDGVPENTH